MRGDNIFNIEQLKRLLKREMKKLPKVKLNTKDIESISSILKNIEQNIENSLIEVDKLKAISNKKDSNEY